MKRLMIVARLRSDAHEEAEVLLRCGLGLAMARAGGTVAARGRLQKACRKSGVVYARRIAAPDGLEL